MLSRKPNIAMAKNINQYIVCCLFDQFHTLEMKASLSYEGQLGRGQ